MLLAARGADGLEVASAACREAGAPGVGMLALDITDAASGERVRSACLEHFGRIDVLVNNAGTSTVRALDELTDDDWQAQWELHVMAPMRLMRAAAPAMAEAGWGRIVNVCSSSGKRPGAAERGLLRGEGGGALALARRSPTRTPRVACSSTRSPPGRWPRELWIAPGGLADQVGRRPGHDPRGGARGARRAVFRSGASERPRRSRLSSSSCALRRRPMSPAPRGRSTAALVAVIIWSRPSCCPSTPKPSARPIPPSTYAVGREKIREFAAAVGETNPLHLDLEAARAAGHEDVVAPPMFAVVYAGASLTPALFDPEVGIDFAMMVHGGQEFAGAGWSSPATRSPPRRRSRTSRLAAGIGFYVFESVSKNQRGETVCTGRWTNIVRGAQ